RLYLLPFAWCRERPARQQNVVVGQITTSVPRLTEQQEIRAMLALPEVSSVPVIIAPEQLHVRGRAHVRTHSDRSLAPLLRLQASQAQARFSKSSPPPRATGTTWSTWNGCSVSPQ